MVGVVVVGIAAVEHMMQEYMPIIGYQKHFCHILRIIYTIFYLCRSLSWKESKAL